MTRNTLAVEHDAGTVKRAKCGLEQSSDAPSYLEFTESFAGFEYLNVWRPPFSLIRLFEQEDE